MSKKQSENTEHRRGRKPMTPAEREASQAKREQDAVAREVAINAINSNDQFLDARTWAALDPAKLAEIKAAIGKVEGRIRKAEIKALRDRLAALESEGQE